MGCAACLDSQGTSSYIRSQSSLKLACSRVIPRNFILGFVTFLILLLFADPFSAQTTLTVNSDVDGPGTCPGVCTLRAALQAAGDGDTIAFAGDLTINVNEAGGLGELPIVTSSNVTIDAGGNAIVLDGSQSDTNDPTLAYGLRIEGDDVTVLGLEITGFAGDGIVIDSATGVQIGGDGAGDGNLIHLNGGNGIVLSNAGSDISPNTILGNLIGTDAVGTSVEVNGGAGILINSGSSYNVIGGASSTSANIISGNANGGIIISGSSNNIIEGNRIGLDAGSGLTGLGNGTSADDAGIRIAANGTDNQVIDNAVAASTGSGIIIVNSDDNSLTGNFIGLDALLGQFGVGNAANGIEIQDSNGTVISDNSIGANGSSGVLITGTSSNNTVSSNRIGVGANGTSVLPNLDDGIKLDGVDDNEITGNTIASNASDGVEIIGGSGNTLADNRVGVDANLDASGNVNHGVFLTGNADSNTIRDNHIAENGSDGISMESGNGNTFAGNILLNNMGLGIDLAPDGVTDNDAGDVDTGPNSLQNFPEFGSALFDGTTTTVTGSLNSVAGSTFVIEFFSNTQCDPTDHGEAEIALTTVNVTTNGAGNAIFTTDLSGLTGGDFVTATATNSATGDTSELALCEEVEFAAPIADFSAAPLSGEAPLTVNFTDESTGVIDSYLWDFGDGNTSTVANPSNEFAAAGNYLVALTVNGPGGSDASSLTIDVTVPAPDTDTPVPSTSEPQEASTPVPQPTATLLPTNSPTPPALTATSTATFTATASSTSVPTQTSTATLTATGTATETPRPSATFTSTATQTMTPTLRPSATLPPTATSTLIPTATATPTITPDLGVTKEVVDDGVRIVVENNSAADANNVRVVESLRSGVRYISSRPGSPVCIEDEGVVYCALGTIGGGASSAVDIGIRTDGTSPTSGETIITSDGIQLVVIDEPYLLKIGEPPVAGPGTIVTYTLRVINPTDRPAAQVRVVDQMPDTLQVVSGSATEGVITVDGQHVDYRLARLGPGERVTIRLVTRVRESDLGSDEIRNRACLTSQLNRTPSCAEMRFLRAGALPVTGQKSSESQWLVYALFSLAGLTLISAFILLHRRRSLIAVESPHSGCKPD